MTHLKQSSNGMIRETITIKGFKELIENLLKTFPNLKISPDQIEFMFQSLKDIPYKAMKKAIERIRDTQEAIRGGSNLIYLIKNNVRQYEQNKDPIGWICSSCENVVPLSESRCDCEFVGQLTDEQKDETIRKIEKMGCKIIAENLKKDRRHPAFDDQVPF